MRSDIDTDQKLEDENLRRMLNTPPTPHKAKTPTTPKRRRGGSVKQED